MKNIFLIFILVAFYNCENPKSTQTPQEIENQTPKALNDNSGINMSSRLGKRYGANIIEELYAEAQGKDVKLKALNKKISNYLEDSLNNNTKEYNKYNKNNILYYSILNEYIQQINDTIVRQNIQNIVDTLKSKYGKSVAQHEALLDSIQIRKSQLNDQAILMKIFITEPMMKNYQINELPDIQSLESTVLDIESIIEETKPYTKVQK